LSTSFLLIVFLADVIDISSASLFISFQFLPNNFGPVVPRLLILLAKILPLNLSGSNSSRLAFLRASLRKLLAKASRSSSGVSAAFRTASNVSGESPLITLSTNLSDIALGS